MKETLRKIMELIEDYDKQCEETFDYHKRITKRGSFIEESSAQKNSLELNTLSEGPCYLTLTSYDDYSEVENYKALLDDIKAATRYANSSTAIQEICKILSYYE